jgi:hypothetical protein
VGGAPDNVTANGLPTAQRQSKVCIHPLIIVD